MPAPHHLADTLRAFLDSRDVSVREVGAAVGVSHSTLSRLRVQRIESSSLAKLLAWCATDLERRELLEAHLWDELVRAGVDPAAFWAEISEPDFAWFARLPLKVQAAVQALGTSAASDPAFADLLDGMAERRIRAACSAADAAAGRQPDGPRFARRQKSDPVRAALTAEKARRAARSLPVAPQSSPSASGKAG